MGRDRYIGDIPPPLMYESVSRRRWDRKLHVKGLTYGSSTQIIPNSRKQIMSQISLTIQMDIVHKKGCGSSCWFKSLQLTSLPPLHLHMYHSVCQNIYLVSNQHSTRLASIRTFLYYTHSGVRQQSTGHQPMVTVRW